MSASKYRDEWVSAYEEAATVALESGETDWRMIEVFYGALPQGHPSLPGGGEDTLRLLSSEWVGLPQAEYDEVAREVEAALLAFYLWEADF